MYKSSGRFQQVTETRWNQRTRSLHKGKLRTMKSTLDTTRPATFKHMDKKPKKEQMIEERFTEIERENRILLEKMTSMHKRPNKYLPSNTKKTLNDYQRRQRLAEITKENQSMLRRLQERKPTYDISQWEDSRREEMRRIRNICAYPYRLGTSSRRTRSTERPSRLDPLLTPSDLPTVLEIEKEIAGETYQVQVKTDERRLAINVKQEGAQEYSQLEIPYAEAFEMMNDKSDYSGLVDLLNLENGQLVLNSNV